VGLTSAIKAVMIEKHVSDSRGVLGDGLPGAHPGPALDPVWGPVPAGRGFWTEFSVALAFIGLAILGLQFGVTARLRHVTSAWGIDIIYHFHRQVSLIAAMLVVAHPIILFISNPATLELLNPMTAPWRVRFGLVALVCLLLLIVISLGRLQLRIRYEAWRLSHGVLATLVVAMAMLNMLGVGHYIALPWKQVFWAALTFIWIGLPLYVRVFKPLFMLRRPYEVERVIEERGDAYTLILRPVKHEGMRHKAGQFTWLTLWNAPFDVTEHPFSIASSASNSSQLALTIKNLGDFTSTIPHLRPGKRAYLDGPYGAFSLDRFPAHAYTFIAGGIGITPIMSILRTMGDRGDQRPLALLYGNKTWEDVTFREELEGLKERLNLRVVHVLEQPPENWNGETGFITAEMLRQQMPKTLEQHEYFICGPDSMMDAVEKGLHALGVPLGKYHSERYNLI
jgi:predicted ferric reductase